MFKINKYLLFAHRNDNNNYIVGIRCSFYVFLFCLETFYWRTGFFFSRAGVQTDSSNNSNHDATTDDDATLQQRRAGNLQHAARGFAVELLYSMSAATSNRRSQQTRPSHVRPQAQAQRPSSQQQTLEQNVLPDLITSCTTPHDRSADKESAEAKTARPPTVRPSSYRSSSRSAVRPSIRFTVKLCPRCYHDRRKSSLLLQCTSCRILEEKTDRSPPDNDDVSLYFCFLFIFFLDNYFLPAEKRFYFRRFRIMCDYTDWKVCDSFAPEIFLTLCVYRDEYLPTFLKLLNILNFKLLTFLLNIKSIVVAI